MEINYKLSVDDYTEFNIHYVLNDKNIQRRFKAQKIAGSVLLVVVAILLFIYLPLTKPLSRLVIPAILIGIAITWYLSFDKLVTSRTISQTKKTISKIDNELLENDIELSFKDDKIIIKQKHEDIYDYNDVDKIYYTDDYIFIYVLSNAIIIPKQAINAQDSDFISLTFADKVIS